MERERKAVILEGYTVREVGSTFFVMPRSEIWTLKKPKTVSKRLKSIFHAPDLSTMLRMCRGEESQDKMGECGTPVVSVTKVGGWYSFKERIERRRVFTEDGYC